MTGKTCTAFEIKSHGKVVGFPYIYQGNRYAIKYRDFNFSKGQRKYHMHIEGTAPCTFFGWQAIHSRKILAIAGGELDAASVRQMTNIPCVSPPNGDKSLVDTVKFHLEDLLQFNQIILIPDNDAHANEAYREAAELLRKDQVKFVSLAMMDPSAYLQASDYEGFKKIFYAGERLVDSLLMTSIKQCSTKTETIECDVKFFISAMMGVRTGEVTLILGHTGQGKSSVSRWLTIKFAEFGYRTGIFSLEEQPDSYGETLDTLYQSIEGDVDEYVTMSTMHGQLDLSDFAAACAAMVKLHDCKVIIVDNLTAACDPSNTNESLNLLMKEVNSIAADLNVHIICVSHTSREAEKQNQLKRMKGEDTMPPQVADAFGSSFIEKFAWNIVSMHITSVGQTRFEVLKARKGIMSLPTETIMRFSRGFYE